MLASRQAEEVNKQSIMLEDLHEHVENVQEHVSQVNSEMKDTLDVAAGRRQAVDVGAALLLVCASSPPRLRKRARTCDYVAGLNVGGSTWSRHGRPAPRGPAASDAVASATPPDRRGRARAARAAIATSSVPAIRWAAGQHGAAADCAMVASGLPTDVVVRDPTPRIKQILARRRQDAPPPWSSAAGSSERPPARPRPPRKQSLRSANRRGLRLPSTTCRL